MGVRLTGFDYSRPYFYMVTIRCHAGIAALSRIVAPGKCELNAITRAFVHVIRGFHEHVVGLCPIECFSVMPDHIHLLIRLAGETESKTLSLFRLRNYAFCFLVASPRQDLPIRP